MIRSLKVLTMLVVWYTLYRRGIWTSQRTLCENNLLSTIQLASLSHSSIDLNQQGRDVRCTFHRWIFGILPFGICLLLNLQRPLRVSVLSKRYGPLVSSARYLPPMKLSVFKKMVRNRDSPIGLYLRLNLSKRWKLST